MSRKLPRDPALPWEQDDSPVRPLSRRLSSLLSFMIDRLNLLLDGYLASMADLPTAAAEYRSRMVVIPGGPGVADRLYWCRKTSIDTFEWKEIS